MAALRGRCHHCQMKNRTTRARTTLWLHYSYLPLPLSITLRPKSAVCGRLSADLVPDRACLPAFLSLGGHQKAFLQLSLSTFLRISICLCGFAFSFGLRFCFLRFTIASKQGQLLPAAPTVPPPVGNVNIYLECH